MKMVFINGRFLPEAQSNVSILDRGFLYGDGLFETLRVYNGQPFRWQQHWERLERGAKLLKIRIPVSSAGALGFARQLLQQNEVTEAVLRINLSRGIGTRGYSPQGATQPLFVMSLHEAPLTRLAEMKLTISSYRLQKSDPLAAIKSSNKLLQILARMEAEEKGATDALFLNNEGEVAETTSGNIFWIEKETICTPPLSSGILPGITRAAVLELCGKLKILHGEKNVRLEKLKMAQGVFLTLSTLEIVEVVSINGKALPRSPLISRLVSAYRDLVTCETTSGQKKTAVPKNRRS